MKLYRLVEGHIPLEKCNIAMPSIPANRLLHENNTLPRICTSSSFDGCLTAIGPTTIGLVALLNVMSQADVDTKEGRLKAMENLAFPYTVLEFDIPKDAPYLMRTNAVAMHVPDAWLTQECWLTQPCCPVSVSHKWLVDGTIDYHHLLLDGEKYTYLIVRNSRLSDSCEQITTIFKRSILKVTEDWLRQEQQEEKFQELHHVLSGLSLECGAK